MTGNDHDTLQKKKNKSFRCPNSMSELLSNLKDKSLTLILDLSQFISGAV